MRLLGLVGLRRLQRSHLEERRGVVAGKLEYCVQTELGGSWFFFLGVMRFGYLQIGRSICL